MLQLRADKYRHQYWFGDSTHPEADYDHLRFFVNGMCKDGEFATMKGAFHKSGSRPWSYGKVWPIEGVPPIVIAHGWIPKKGLTSWFEFNPTKLGPDGIHALRMIINFALFRETFGFLHYGHVGYAELYADIDNVSHTDCLFIDTQLRTSDSYFTPAGTTYLGSRKGDRLLVCYAKEKQLLEKEGVALGHQRLRIEARLRPSSWTALSDLPQQPNPFKSLLVIPKVALGDKHLPIELNWLQTQMTKHDLSAQDAFVRVARTFPSSRKALVAELQQRACGWWNPTDLWATATQAVEWHKLLLPSASH